MNLPAPVTSGAEYLPEAPMDQAGGAPASAFQVKRLLTFFLKYWWLPALTLALGFGAGVALVHWMPPDYVSKAHIWETVKVQIPEGNVFQENEANFLGTQTELLQSSTLRDLALELLTSTSNSAAIARNKDGTPLPVTVRVSQAKASSVYELVASSSQPAYTEAYLDALMSVYLDYKRNMRKLVSGDTLASITEQLQATERDLTKSQEIFIEFQRSNNLAMMQEASTVGGGHLATLRVNLADLQMNDRLLTASQAKEDERGTNASPNWDPTSILGSSAASAVPAEHQAAFKELELMKMKREKLSRYLRPKHPTIVKLDEQIEHGQKLLELYQRQNKEQLATLREGYQLKMQEISNSIAEVESRVMDANSLIAKAERLKLNVQHFQNDADQLRQMEQRLSISRNLDQENLAILDQATPAKRSYNQETSAIAGASVGGLGVGIVIILLIAFRDDRFTSMMEITDKFQNHIVGQVPDMPLLARGSGRTNGQVQSLPLLEIDDQRHIYVESYRNLRSALFYLPSEGDRPKVLLVTSAVPNEGKSTIAANLARIMALGGSSVLLVDADLRRGALHETMGLNKEPGLSELLHQPDRLNEIIQRSSLPNLVFIARGKSVTNPGDLFLSREFDQLLAEWRRQFEYVVIDTSPVFAADDATTLAPKVDGTLFVVRSRYSRASPVQGALELLNQRRVRILGVVVNRADSSARSYYYYKHSDYSVDAKTG